MKSFRMAKQLTFVYFAIFSIALVSIHILVFYYTFEGVERDIAEKRFAAALPKAIEKLEQTPSDKVEVEPLIFAFIDRKFLPKEENIKTLIKQQNVAYEIHPVDITKPEYFILQSEVLIKGIETTIWMLDFKDVYAMTREEMFWSQRSLIVTSLLLVLLSLLVVQLIAKKLTDPLFNLAKTLSKRSPEDTAPVDIPTGVVTSELGSLVTSVNAYQNKISELIQRERAFNNYASHELRSPLAVIKGSISLLKAAKPGDLPFIAKQVDRLSDSAQEMDEFIRALLFLTRSCADEKSEWVITKKTVMKIADTFRYLIDNKNIDLQIAIKEGVKLQLPGSVFHILLGNLVKNAFAYTDSGHIKIIINENRLSVIDTGQGLVGSSSNYNDGHGLGILIVKDICRKYGYKFNLKDNETLGCTASVDWSEKHCELNSKV